MKSPTDVAADPGNSEQFGRALNALVRRARASGVDIEGAYNVDHDGVAYGIEIYRVARED